MLWDEAQQRLFAARDRFGIKPLFFAWHEGALYLASEVKALFAAGVPGALESRGVVQRRPLSAGSPTDTLYEGVSQVPPGHYLLAGPSGIQIHRYWDFNYPLADAAAAGALGRRVGRGVAGGRWTRRCGSGSGPTCRSAAI